MSVKLAMQKKLEKHFDPIFMELRDDSHKHAGHIGARPEGETHFHLTMTSVLFLNKSRIQCQRMVNKVLADDLKERVHALSMSLSAPEV